MIPTEITSGAAEINSESSNDHTANGILEPLLVLKRHL